MSSGAVMKANMTDVYCKSMWGDQLFKIVDLEVALL